MTKLLLDTNLYVDWFNRGLHEPLVLGQGFVRYLSSVVQMELRVGAETRPARRMLDQLARAHTASARITAPSVRVFDEAGLVLRALRMAGREVRRASLVNDVLIALTARSLGATLYTGDVGDFPAIREVRAFSLEIVRPAP
ncbi:MAG: type II toxin-antitoxin system VapC family toxin [Candidatus Binatia bacterium]